MHGYAWSPSSIAGLVSLVILAVPGAVPAHDNGLGGLSKARYSMSRSVLKLQGAMLTVEVVLPRELADHLAVPPGTGSGASVEDHVAEAAVASRVDVHRGDEACGGAIDSSGPAGPGGFRVTVRYACPGGDQPIRVVLAFLEHFGVSHRHLAAVDDGSGSRTEVLQGSKPSVELKPGAGTWLPTSFLALGVEHILGGYDHLVFLLGLILLGGTWRGLLGTVTAFTVAHSVTLVLAALDVWNPGAAFVEPAIGLTIAYVGVENLFLKEPKGRWRITFVLGLVHGFGFASALADAGLARNHLVPALLLFNLGVEAGQVMVLLVILPLILWARQADWVSGRAVPAMSVGIALVGATLFVTRLF